ncbi:MAG TPA: hypothetical protein VJL31_13105 [Gemmatimonadales bacterium]|nr:hypothetical protein [Gemmatimonadales bacterium]
MTDLWGIAWPWLIALVLGLAVAIPIACWLMPPAMGSALGGLVGFVSVMGARVFLAVKFDI